MKEGADKARIDGKIELLDITGQPIATYQFKQGWPIKYVAASLDAASNNVAMEELHIAHEGFERV
jgi:phage tail-like protein